MRKKCESYFDVITKKIIAIIDYLSVVKICIDTLSNENKLIIARLERLERNFDPLPKGKNPIKRVFK